MSKIWEKLYGTLVVTGGVALGFRNLRQSQHCRGYKYLTGNDYADAAFATMGGCIATAIVPPLAIVFTAGVIMEETARYERNQRKD